jgi:hypothetical protein
VVPARRRVSPTIVGASPNPFSMSADTGKWVQAAMSRAWPSASSRSDLAVEAAEGPAQAPRDAARALSPIPTGSAPSRRPAIRNQECTRCRMQGAELGALSKRSALICYSRRVLGGTAWFTIEPPQYSANQ